MKIAIQRVQSQTCLGIAEREQFGTEFKKQYQKPETNVIEIEIHGMLAASPPGWNGEVGSREFELWEE